MHVLRCTIKKDAKDTKVFIKLPSFTTIKNNSSFKTSNNKCSIKKGKDILWSGYAGETAKFDLEVETGVDIYLEGLREPKYAMYGLLLCIPTLAFFVLFIVFMVTISIAVGIIFVFLALGCVSGSVYMGYSCDKKLRTVKIVSQKVEPGSKYELIDVENNNTFYFDPAKVKYKLREVDVIDSRD